MADIPVALQLFAVRGECKNDLAATLGAVAEIGYVGAEPWGYNGESADWMGTPAADVRKMYDDAGLVCCGMHVMTGALLGDNLQRTIELNQILGNQFVIIACDQERMSSLEGITELADILNETADTLSDFDMYTGYHAHGFDFEEIGGTWAWEILFRQTAPDVIMQMDIGNCASGGGDPIAMLKKFPGTARSVHLKEFGGPQGAVIGEGEADWEEIFRLCENEHPTEWYVVEEGGPEGLGFDVCKRSFEALRAMGKV